MLTFFCAAIIVILIIAVILLLNSNFDYRDKNKEFNAKYGNMLNVENAEKESLRRVNETEKNLAIKVRDTEANLANKVNDIQNKIKNLSSEYNYKKSELEILLKELAGYSDEQNVLECGLYKPFFDFGVSVKYKNELNNLKDLERGIIKNDEAVNNTFDISSGSSSAEIKLIKNITKLLLRTFNSECDNIISEVRWNNANKMEERMRKSFEMINKLGMEQKLSQEYLKIKIKELKLTYEYKEKLYQEKEEQKQIQAEMREEEQAQKEIEKALKQAEDEEKAYLKAIEQANKDIAKAIGPELIELQEKIAKLQKELEETQLEKERALSMAQLTKAGHVYIVSNIGSFGEGVYKVGMTRRLEPTDRVKELSGASVPFEFDIHAMIYSENAPALENLLHKSLTEKRVNKVNERKEFFYATLDEIETVVIKNNFKIEFTKLAEAREYRETLAKRNEPKVKYL